MSDDRKRILVTGGSRGIGAAICRLAAARGCDVAINFRSDEASAQKVARSCRDLGAKAEIIQGDMAKQADIERVFQNTDRLIGRIDHFINNAGVTGQLGRLDEAHPDTIRACIDVNVTGALLAARQAILRLSPRHGGNGGSIVNLSSVAASLGAPNDYVWYAASKGAVDTMTIGLAKELAGDGIRVNAVSPGLIDTEIHASSGMPDRAFKMAHLVPMARVGTADEIAEAVLFLISDAASYVTGANLRVSGGR